MGKQKKKEKEVVFKKKEAPVKRNKTISSFRSLFDKTNYLQEQVKAREMIKEAKMKFA